MMKRLWVILLCFISVFFIGCGSQNEWINTTNTNASICSEEKNDSDFSEEVGEKKEEYVEKRTIIVYICGEVNNPGVYTLEEGKRICDAISLAGGLTENADTLRINQALLLEDEQQIYVPSNKDFSEPLENDNFVSNSTDSKVNINTANISELQTITGIGESRAVSIIEYREKNGKFKATEDIMQVPGIKEGLYEKIKDKIKVK